MLQIKSLNPMSNYARVTHEFLDDKIIVKVKSLTTEYEKEVKYEDIKHIQLVRTTDLRWLTLGLFVILLPGFLSWIFSLIHWNFSVNPPFPLIGRLIIIAGIALCIPAFQKFQAYFFMDRARNNVVSIKMDIRNKATLEQAVELVRQKSTILSETNPQTPFPDSPLFSYSHNDLTDILNKTVAMFYENYFMVKDSSFAEKSVTVINYDEVSGKVVRLKTMNNGWLSWAASLFMVFAAAFWGVEYLFPQLWQVVSVGLVAKVAFGLIGFLFLLSLFKIEVIMFYNKDDTVVYWAKPDRNKPELLENIIKYIKSKSKTG
jgi:hypothetical protein